MPQEAERLRLQAAGAQRDRQLTREEAKAQLAAVNAFTHDKCLMLLNVIGLFAEVVPVDKDTALLLLRKQILDKHERDAQAFVEEEMERWSSWS